MADVGLAMQHAMDKTEHIKARASAVEELEKTGTFDDLTQLGDGHDEIDRQLAGSPRAAPSTASWGGSRAAIRAAGFVHTIRSRPSQNLHAARGR